MVDIPGYDAWKTRSPYEDGEMYGTQGEEPEREDESADEDLWETLEEATIVEEEDIDE